MRNRTGSGTLRVTHYSLRAPLHYSIEEARCAEGKITTSRCLEGAGAGLPPRLSLHKETRAMRLTRLSGVVALPGTLLLFVFLAGSTASARRPLARQEGVQEKNGIRL